VEFQLKILLVSFFATIVLGIIAIPLLQRLNVGQSEREDGPKSHLKKSGTPTMGGVIMAISIVGATIVAFIHYIGKEPEIGKRLIPLILVSIGFGIIGFIDDYKKVVLRNTDGLKPKQKMLGLFIISIVFIIYIDKILGIGTDIIIPYGVKIIGDGAFKNCAKLSSLTLGTKTMKSGNFEFPNTLTSIGKSAFNGCNSINTIVMPSSITDMSKSLGD